MKVKKCSGECGEIKPETKEFFYFGKDRQKYGTVCKECLKIYHIKRIKKFPWKRIFNNINSRCYNSKEKGYDNYGGRGIECLITVEELEILWYRDKAWLLEQPSIDRKDNDGNYTFDNCEFIEHGVNSAKDKLKAILQYSKDNKLIKKWNSIIEASRQLKINDGNISQCCKNIRSSAGGFIWRYENANV